MGVKNVQTEVQTERLNDYLWRKLTEELTQKNEVSDRFINELATECGVREIVTEFRGRVVDYLLPTEEGRHNTAAPDAILDRIVKNNEL